MATQEERKAETRQRLLDAAADLFATKGVHAVSVDAVAAAADRTSGAVYAHFGGKEGLLAALLERWSGQAAADIAAELDAATGVDDRLAAVWRRFVDGGEPDAGPGDRGDAWLLLEHELWLHAARTPEAADDLADRFARGRAGMGAAFAEWATAAGAERSPVPPDRLAVLAMGLLFGLEMQRRVDPAAVPDDLAVTGLRLLLGLPAEAG